MPLRQLCPNPELVPPGAPDTAKIDIVAVHGLNPKSKDDATHAWDTWRTPGGSSGRLWLRDDLPQYLADTRIFLYEYNSTAVYGRDKDTFTGKANELLEAVRIERDDEVETRPILFLGHSLGGLLIKQALINAHNNPKYTSIKNSTKGLAFFGTPHNGGDWKLLSLGSVVAKIATATGFQQGEDILETLKKGSIFSELMQDSWRHQLMKYDIVSFWGAYDNIVPLESARFGMPGDRENVVKLNADHYSLCKFGTTQTDLDNFKLVRANIKDIYKNALKQSVPSGGPAGSAPGQYAPGFGSYVSPPPPPMAHPTTPQPMGYSTTTAPHHPPLPPRGSPLPPSGPPGGGPPPDLSQPITGLVFSPAGTDPRATQAAEYKNAGCWEQARQVEQQIFDEYQRTLGAAHATTLGAGHDIAATMLELGFFDDCDRWVDWIVQTGTGVLGAKHPILLKTKRLKGEVLALRGRHQEAETTLSGVLIDQQERLGNDHLDTLETERALGQTFHLINRSADARAGLEHRVEALKRQLGENHIMVALAVVELASVLIPNMPEPDPYYWSQHTVDSGIRETAMLLNSVYTRLRASVGAQNQVTIRALRVYGHAKMAQGDYTECGNLLRRALHNSEETLGRDHPETMAIVVLMGLMHKKQDETNNPMLAIQAVYQEGRNSPPAMRPWFQRYVEWLEARLGIANPEARAILQVLADSYAAEKNYREAEKYFERLVRSFQMEGISSPAARQASTWLQICRMNTGLAGRYGTYRAGRGGNSSDLNALFSRLGFRK